MSRLWSVGQKTSPAARILTLIQLFDSLGEVQKQRRIVDFVRIVDELVFNLNIISLSRSYVRSFRDDLKEVTQ